jgi:hypothetical protein
MTLALDAILRKTMSPPRGHIGVLGRDQDPGVLELNGYEPGTIPSVLECQSLTMTSPITRSMSFFAIVGPDAGGRHQQNWNVVLAAIGRSTETLEMRNEQRSCPESPRLTSRRWKISLYPHPGSTHHCAS